MNLPKILQPFHCPDLIRLGSANDGGYLVDYQDVLKSKKLLSFGIGDNIDFEMDFVSITDCQVLAYDDVLSVDFDFFESDKRSAQRKRVTAGTVSEALDDCYCAFLKCDIEGGEYEILDELIGLSSNFAGMVIEFHDINDYKYFNALTSFIAKVGHRLIHTHVNNNSYIESPMGYTPSVIELTFSSSNNSSYRPVSFPHRLDAPNAPERDEFLLTFV